jgi:hypothetical protein
MLDLLAMICHSFELYIYEGCGSPCFSSRFLDSCALWVSYCIILYKPAYYYICDGTICGQAAADSGC